MNEINQLREEVRAIVAAYDPAEDFELTVMKLASVGYRLEEALPKA